MTNDDERLLASRFASRKGRKDLAALYAFEDELGRIAPAVSQPLLGEIRLAWWREGLEELGTAPARSPVLAALEEPVLAGRISREGLVGLVDARHAELEPFPDELALFRFMDASQGGLMLLAARALDPSVQLDQVIHAARAYAYGRLPDRWWPLSWAETPRAAAEVHAITRSHEERHIANLTLRKLPTAAFPAVAHATLINARRRESQLRRKWRLFCAVLFGQL